MGNQTLFIGVAGPRAKHVEVLAKYYSKLMEQRKGDEPRPYLFIGLQTSRKSLNGESENPVYADRMNTRKEILEACEIAKSFPETKIIVHYNPSGDYSAPEVAEQVHWLAESPIDGLQWNGFSSEYSPKTDPKFEQHFGPAGVLAWKEFSILQITNTDFHNPELFALRISWITKHYSHLLFDPSCGLGKSLEEDTAINWAKVLLGKNLPKGLVFSGGLGPDEGGLDVIRRIRQATGNKAYFSFDAEGKLRDHNGFSIAKAESFLDKAIACYR